MVFDSSLRGSPTTRPNDAGVGHRDAASQEKNQRYDKFSILTASMSLPNIQAREEALARLADSLEPIYTFLEMGSMTVESFQVAPTMKDPQGHLVSVWELRLGGPYTTGKPLRWQTIRLWRNDVVIAEQIANHGRPSERLLPCAERSTCSRHLLPANMQAALSVAKPNRDA